MNSNLFTEKSYDVSPVLCRIHAFYLFIHSNVYCPIFIFFKGYIYFFYSTVQCTLDVYKRQGLSPSLLILFVDDIVGLLSIISNLKWQSLDLNILFPTFRDSFTKKRVKTRNSEKMYRQVLPPCFTSTTANFTWHLEDSYSANHSIS